MQKFWKALPKPFFVLAPMDDVTDVVFREMVAEAARPDVFFTEFTNADGLNSKGVDRVIQKLKYTQNQRYIIAQIWGSNPGNIYKSAKLIAKLGFDGVDINMGCPVDAVMKKECGSGIIGNTALAKEIILAAQEGAKTISVSVKTRLGKSSDISDEWIPFLLEQKLDALTIHARTAKQQSKGEANWGNIGQAVIYRDKISPETVIIGNGDIKSYQQGVKMSQKYNIDGIMVGRGIFTNPWVFEKGETPVSRDKEAYLQLLLRHLDLFDQTWGKEKNFAIMKKFFKMYINHFDGASLLRQELMECKTSDEVRQMLKIKKQD